MSSHNDNQIYGISAEFNSAHSLLEAVRRARSAGYTKVEAYTPYPIEGLHEALGRKRSRLPWLIFLGGLTGAIGGYGMQWYAMEFAYSINIGGRPLHSYPSFIPVTFELTVLLASLTALAALLLLNRLPKLHHPVFNTLGFERASQDRFFLVIEAQDQYFSRNATRDFFQESSPIRIEEVKSE